MRMGSGAGVRVQILTLTLTTCVPLAKLLSCVSVFSSTKWGYNINYPGCYKDLMD